MTDHDCRPIGREHVFDPGSGYCVNGCGARDDGLKRNVAGVVIWRAEKPAPAYPQTPIQFPDYESETPL